MVDIFVSCCQSQVNQFRSSTHPFFCPICYQCKYFLSVNPDYLVASCCLTTYQQQLFINNKFYQQQLFINNNIYQQQLLINNNFYQQQHLSTTTFNQQQHLSTTTFINNNFYHNNFHQQNLRLIKTKGNYNADITITI